MPLKIGAGAATPPFLVMDVIRAANERARRDPGTAVIRMEVGQPSTPAPQGALRAVEAAIRSGAALGYTEALGIPGLRARIASHYGATFGQAVEPARVAVTLGASGGFVLAFLAAFDRGDRVAMAAPFYPPYRNILTALGMEPVLLPADASTRFQPTVAMLDALPFVPDGLILASPCNPAGTMLHADELAALAAWAEARGVRIVSDEIYHGLTYGIDATTAATIPGAIVVNSFSKWYSMTGWRVGWLVLPDDLVRPVERLAQNLFISPPGVSQVAALAAFDCDEELRANHARYATNRALLLDALPSLGFARLAPAEGAFYLWAELDAEDGPSPAFCQRLLEQAAIAATPGVDFDERGERFVRFSFCGSTEDMREAVRRLRRFRRNK